MGGWEGEKLRRISSILEAKVKRPFERHIYYVNPY